MYAMIELTAVSLGIVEVDSDSDLLSTRSLVNQLIQVLWPGHRRSGQRLGSAVYAISCQPAYSGIVAKFSSSHVVSL